MIYFLAIELSIFLILGRLLILKRITRNSLIGYRTKSSLESDDKWFKYNKVLGYHLVGCSAVQIILILFFLKSLRNELVQAMIVGGLPLFAIVSTSLTIKFLYKK